MYFHGWCPEWILCLGFFFQSALWFWDLSMLLQAGSSFFPVSFPCRVCDCMCGGPLLICPVLMNTSWSLTPGNPSAVLNPRGLLGICEGTCLGSILRSRQAVLKGYPCAQSHKILPGCSPNKRTASVPLQCRRFFLFFHILTSRWFYQNSEFLTLWGLKTVPQVLHCTCRFNTISPLWGPSNV